MAKVHEIATITVRILKIQTRTGIAFLNQQ
jgi:hypothetical protein